jgi:class 3 adenylate cyclase
MIAGLREAMKQPIERRLAADVVGYSRLMGVDEEGTHERLTAHFRGLVDPKIKEHRGRTVKNTGDGLLAEVIEHTGADEIQQHRKTSALVRCRLAAGGRPRV